MLLGAMFVHSAVVGSVSAAGSSLGNTPCAATQVASFPGIRRKTARLYASRTEFRQLSLGRKGSTVVEKNGARAGWTNQKRRNLGVGQTTSGRPKLKSSDTRQQVVIRYGSGLLRIQFISSASANDNNHVEQSTLVLGNSFTRFSTRLFVGMCLNEEHIFIITEQ